MKFCNVCKTEKPLSSFGLQKGRPRHLCTDCKNKQSREYYLENKERKAEWSKKYRLIKKDQDLKKAYGITFKEYQQMLLDQKHSCKICGVHEKECNRSLCVDHCHTTGKIRGLLCDTCNRGLGLLREDVEVLQKAIEYLNENIS